MLLIRPLAAAAIEGEVAVVSPAPAAASAATGAATAASAAATAAGVAGAAGVHVVEFFPAEDSCFSAVFCTHTSNLPSALRVHDTTCAVLGLGFGFIVWGVRVNGLWLEFTE